MLSGGRGVPTVQTTINNAVARSNEARVQGARWGAEFTELYQRSLRNGPDTMKCPPGSACETETTQQHTKAVLHDQTTELIKILSDLNRSQQWAKVVQDHRRTCANRLFESSPTDSFEYRIAQLESSIQTQLAHIALNIFLGYHQNTTELCDNYKPVKGNTCAPLELGIWNLIGDERLGRLMEAETSMEAARILTNFFAKLNTSDIERMKKLLQRYFCR